MIKHISFRQAKNVDLGINGVNYLFHFLDWFNDQQVTRYLKRRKPMLLLTERKYLETMPERWNTDQSFILLAKDGEKKTPIGVMGLHRINAVHRTASTGAVIGNRDYWSRGYGPDAKMLLLDYAFNTLNLRKITSSVIAFNERSQKYNEKCGYRVTGRRVAQLWSDGAYHDELLMEVFKDDWLPLWEQFKKNGMTMKAS